MEQEKNGGSEIVVVGNQGLADMTDDIVASAERRVAQIDKIITLSLRNTNEHDWVDQNGKPYLTSSGAEKVARLFGVSWKILKSEKIVSDDEKGKFYFYQVIGVFSLAGGKDTVEAIGTCSSKDQFFAKVNGEFKPLSEIDETNIMKASYSNCVVNGITRLLGIRNLTWERLAQAKIDQSKVASVKYANGGAGGGLISQAQIGRLLAIGKANGYKEADIDTYIKEEYKYDSKQKIEKKTYEDICANFSKKAIEM